MFASKDYAVFLRKEFIILHKTKFFVEIVSKSTGHCWIVYKHGSPDKYPVWVYHKHCMSDKCYHLHRKKNCVEMVAKEILQHDQYVLSGHKQIFRNKKVI